MLYKNKPNITKIFLICLLPLSMFASSCTDKSKNNKNNSTDDVFQSDFSFSQSQVTSADDVSCDIGEAYTTRIEPEMSESVTQPDISALQSDSSSDIGNQNTDDYSNDIYDDWENSVAESNSLSEKDNSNDGDDLSNGDKSIADEQSDGNDSASQSAFDGSTASTSASGNEWTEFY